MAKHVLHIEYDDQTSALQMNLPTAAVVTLGLLGLAREYAQARLVNPLVDPKLIEKAGGDLRFPMLPGGKKWTPHGVE